MRRIAQSAAVLAFGLVSCTGAAAPTPSERDAITSSPATTESSQASCAGEELSGVYEREFTAENTDSSDLLGAWTLEIDGCSYRLGVDGIEQGLGHIELVDGTAASGRIGLSEELLCGNEFTGVAFYDIILDGASLSFAEAIQGTDLCEGRAEAFAGPPDWVRQ